MPIEAIRRRRSRSNGSDSAPVDAAGTDMADGDAAITLGLLDAVHDNASISQRSLASKLGIAIGLTNAYVRRCIRRGWVKVNEAPANRYAYYLTPKGFAEKSRLTARYLSSSFGFYRRAREQCDALLGTAVARGWSRIGLVGLGDLAEITVLCATAHPVTLTGIIAPEAAERRFVNMPVVPTLAALGPVDALMLTEFRRPQASYDALAREVSLERILVPELLKVRSARAVAAPVLQE